MQGIESAPLFVYPRRRLIDGVLIIGIVLEQIRINDPIRVSATDGKGIADDCPLRLAEETQHFAQIVDKPGQNEPARMAILANGLGGLERVIDLAQIDI